MKNKNDSSFQLPLIACAVLAMTATVTHAQTKSVVVDAASARVEQLQQQLVEQAAQIKALGQAVAEQNARQRELQKLLGQNPAVDAAVEPQDVPPKADGSMRANDNQDADSRRPVVVGVAPEPEQAPASQASATLFEQPGVLTPKGKLQLEPSVQYSYSSSNRVYLVGYTVIPAILIGLVDVREVKRNTLTGAVTARYGLSNRLEVEARVPYVYRYDDTISREAFTSSSADKAFNARGQDLGDVELAMRYQLNNGGGSSPYVIGSLRLKSRTGKDPFDVVTDCNLRCQGNVTDSGLPLELPTGSGFYSLQPGLTWLFPSDPAVFFGGISYTYNFKRDNVRRLVLNGLREELGTVEPGGVFGINFGMGLALNEKSTFSVGVDLNSVGPIRVNGDVPPSSVRTVLASLLVGYSYRYSNKTTFSVAVSAGLTRDTPDISVTLKIPMSF